MFVEALGWAKSCVEAFGIVAVSLAEPMQFAVATHDHRDVAVRTAAMSLLLCLRGAVGAALLGSPHLKGLKDAQRKQLAGEGDKLGGAPVALPPPRRHFRHGAEQAAPAASGPSGPSGSAASGCKGRDATARGGGAPALLDEGIPRVDLMDELRSGGDVIKQLKDPSWKARLDALGRVQKTLSQHPRLAPGVGALLEALRPRIKDHQVALSVSALQILGKLCVPREPNRPLTRRPRC